MPDTKTRQTVQNKENYKSTFFMDIDAKTFNKILANAINYIPRPSGIYSIDRKIVQGMITNQCHPLHEQAKEEKSHNHNNHLTKIQYPFIIFEKL